ncbi:MAG: hydroxyacid dehydrogenase, partial [Planctomycetes bacterium]|nr:hydroxyacid dehydrogenase [Planctomycetota bacterium]
GMKVIGVDIVERHDFVDYLPMDAALPQADIMVCAMNLTENNAAYFDYPRLSRAKKGLVFVNIARGEMSPARDLLKLMKENRLGGLGMDVYNEESKLAVVLRGKNKDIPRNKNLEGEIEATLALSNRPDVLFTPHNAFNTAESVERKAEQSVEQVVRFLEKGTFIWPVP